MPKPEYKIEDPAQQVVTPGAGGAHPGPFIKSEVLAPFKLKTAEAARLMGLNRPHFSDVLAGDKPVSNTLAYKLEALTGVNADLLIGMQALHDRGAEQAEREGYRKTIKRLVLPTG